MSIIRIPATLLLLMFSAGAVSQSPQIDKPLPPLAIEDRGELTMSSQDEFDYAPWRAAGAPGKVHILQYFSATMADSKIFRPFTDRLQETFPREHYHVTSIINLDAALWGTTGFVVSEVKDSKRKHPGSTLVLDEDGTGANQWQLGDRGAGLLIVDSGGIVRYFTREPMDDGELERSLDLVRGYVEACLKSC